jgi:polyferredoxin
MPQFMLTLVVLGHVLLAAHALRRGDWSLCAALAALPLALLTRRGAARLVSAAVLVVGAGLWAGAGVDFVQQRLAFGEPWLRLACIMAGVLAASLAGGLWLLGRGAQGLFPRGREVELPQAGAFLLTVGLLAVARIKASVPVLLADRFVPGSGWLVVLALGVYAAWLAGRFTDPVTGPRDHKRLRPRVWALFSALFFLQLALGLGGLTDMLMTGKLHLPVPALIIAGPLFRGGGLFMPILFASTVLLVGPAWCSHLCYIGAWDDTASRLGPKVPGVLPRRWVVGGRLATLVLACGGALALRWLDVPVLTAVWLAAGFGLVGVGVMVFVSRRLGGMAHCTAFCPIGLVGNVLGKLMPWRMRIDLPACTRCGSCARACRYSALTMAEIEAGRPGLSCTLCGDCAGACPHDAMHYHCPGLSRSAARAVFLTLAAALHAVFLGVARI